MVKIINGICILLLLIIYRFWFFHAEIIGGDWPYFASQVLSTFTFPVPAWNEFINNGLGGVNPLYPIQSYLHLTIVLFTQLFHFSWIIGEKIAWFGLFLLLIILSTRYFFYSVFPKSSLKIWGITTLIFGANTYILMSAAGGQMGLVLSYAMSPFILGSFIRLCMREKESSLTKSIVLSSIFSSLGLLFDLRIFFITVIATLCFFCFYVLIDWIIEKNFWEVSKRSIFNGFIFIGVPLFFAFLVNAFWIVPYYVSGDNPFSGIDTSYSSIAALRFFSFADFSSAFALLHPNWPENIFGKVSFLHPQFLFLPTIAFSALLFLNKSKNIISLNTHKNILFFSFLAIIGIFLAKGVKLPFPQINEFLFVHVLGFNMFRDSLKWYVLICLSYAILIPFSLEYMHTIITLKVRIYGYHMYKDVLFIFLFLGYFIYLLHPVITGELTKTFANASVPSEYIQLNEFLHKDTNFSRVLWVPTMSRYSFYSNHPSVSLNTLQIDFGKKASVKDISKESFNRLFDIYNVKYIILPLDSDNEIFITDRKYDNKKYEKVKSILLANNKLKKVNTFGKIFIFERNLTKNRFWIDDQNIPYKKNSSSSYIIFPPKEEFKTLYFSEGYNKFWVIKDGTNVISSKRTKDGLNSFALKNINNSQYEIYFSLEFYYFYTRIISFISISILLFFYFIPVKRLRALITR